MSEKLELLHTDRVLIVEGKYDAARLSHLTDAMILLTDGFGIVHFRGGAELDFFRIPATPQGGLSHLGPHPGNVFSNRHNMHFFL